MILGTSIGLPLREVLHWMWLWVLAAILVTALQSVAAGQSSMPFDQLDLLPMPTQEHVDPIPMPNVDRPGLFRYPHETFTSGPPTLHHVLHLNRQGDFEGVVEAWGQLHLSEESIPWKHVGVAVAYLRLDDLDRAQTELRHALQMDPQNSVAEYFLGQVFRARGRQVPFWYEQESDSPYRLISHRSTEGVEGIDKMRSPPKSFLPHYRTLPFDQQAKRHFRRAIRLAPHCDLDRVIQVIEPEIRMVSQSELSDQVTVRHLLRSLGEANYVEKAQLEFGERFVIH